MKFIYKNNKQNLLAITILGLIILFFLSPLLLNRIYYGKLEPTKFNPETWKNTRSEMSRQSLRLRMIDDLLSQNLLIGKNRKQIIALLGEPDNPALFPHEFYYTQDNQIIYYLGLSRDWFTDEEWLILSLNEKGLVTEAKIKINDTLSIYPPPVN